MAKKPAKPKVEKSIEAQLWSSANKLRGNIEPSEYKHVVLSLISQSELIIAMEPLKPNAGNE